MSKKDNPYEKERSPRSEPGAVVASGEGQGQVVGIEADGEGRGQATDARLESETRASDEGVPALDRLVWHPLDERAQSGDLVYLQGDEQFDQWYWYRTRQFRKGMWQEIGMWRRKFGPKDAPQFEIKGYRRVSEFG